MLGMLILMHRAQQQNKSTAQSCLVIGNPLSFFYPWQVVGTSRALVGPASAVFHGWKSYPWRKGNLSKRQVYGTKLWQLLRGERPTTDYTQQRRLKPAHLGIWQPLLSSILLLRHTQTQEMLPSVEMSRCCAHAAELCKAVRQLPHGGV